KVYKHPHAPCVSYLTDQTTTDIYTLSLHDALPIFAAGAAKSSGGISVFLEEAGDEVLEPDVAFQATVVAQDSRTLRADFIIAPGDRKSTRLNSSHVKRSYAVFCLKKK